ncbi:MAG: hypothetical protein WDO74_09570 [Pseudomonadota bacterium]
MRHCRRFIASTLLLGCAVTPVGCDERGKQQSPPSAKVLRTLPAPAPKASASKPNAAAPAGEPAPELLSVSEIPDEARAAPSADVPGPAFKSKLVIDEPQQIGPAGQMSANERGVVMINRADELQLAKRLSSASERARFFHGKRRSKRLFCGRAWPALATRQGVLGEGRQARATRSGQLDSARDLGQRGAQRHARGRSRSVRCPGARRLHQ